MITTCQYMESVNLFRWHAGHLPVTKQAISLCHWMVVAFSSTNSGVYGGLLLVDIFYYYFFFFFSQKKIQVCFFSLLFQFQSLLFWFSIFIFDHFIKVLFVFNFNLAYLFFLFVSYCFDFWVFFLTYLWIVFFSI